MDIRIRAISHKHNCKISIIDISESMKEITKLQNTNPLASIVLSRVTAANVLLGLELKNNERTTSNIITSDGMVKKIITEFENNKIRSFIQVPNFDPNLISKSKNPFVETLGKNGTLVVYQNLNMKDPYISQVDLVDGTIDNDYMYYLKTSNQVNSMLATKAELDSEMNIKKVVGILIQLLPNHTNKDIDFLEQKMGNSNYITNILLESTNYQAVIEDIIEDAKILDSQELVFECTCSVDKVLSSLKMLPKEEINEIILKKEPIEVVCEFCNKKYNITIDQIKNII